MASRTRPYAHVAWCYDAIASAYSLGAIGRAKRWHVDRLKPGERVLYVGAGTGREVAAACAAHCEIEVECVEPCAAMARRLRERLSPWAGRVTIVEQPLRAADGLGGFDWVCGHFFFNVFGAREMPGVLAMAASHVKPGGRMVVADFASARSRLRSDGRQDAYPTGEAARPNAGVTRPTGWLGRVLRSAYYRPVNVAGWGLGMCALHPIYDYAPLLEGLGFAAEERTGVRSIAKLPAMYEVICARKEQGG